MPPENIKKLIQQPVAEKIGDLDECLAWVEQVNNAYRCLDRPGLDAKIIVELKLETILWRSTVLKHLLAGSGPGAGTKRDRFHAVLEALNICLTEDQQRQAEAVLTPDRFARLQAMQGITPPGYPDLALQSGPGVNLDIVANRSSAWPFRKWRQDERFSRYQPVNQGVRYRGVEFMPGDVLLANVNLDGNGIYTSLSDPKSFSSHSAFFAVLEHDGVRFPVVIETYEKGVRPVPLNVFLGPRFCSYVEVYRHVEYTEGHAHVVNQAAARFVEEVRGYNFDSEDQDTGYMSCTTVGRFLHQAAGMTPTRTVSKLAHPNTQANLGKLGYTFFDFFAPVDYLLSDRLGYAGRVDNNQVDRLLARELVDLAFRRQFEARPLDPGKFPLKGRVNRWGIKQIRSESPAGRLIGWFEGFDARNLPKGPDDLMAVITLAEKQIGAVIVKTRDAIIRELEQHNQPVLAELLEHEGINRLVTRSLDLPWLQPKTQLV